MLYRDGAVPHDARGPIELSCVITLADLNKTAKLCTAAASKEFVNVLALQEMPPQGLDPQEQWLLVDPVKKSGSKHPTATDAVVGYQTVKVQAWDAVAATEFSTNRRLRTHIPDITHPTLYTTNAPFTMLGMGCPHPSFHNSYPVTTNDIPNPPIVTEKGFAFAFFIADTKAQVILGGCSSFKAKNPAATVCWLCGKNRATILHEFGCGMGVIVEEWLWAGMICPIVRPPKRHPDYGLHGVHRQVHNGLSALVHSLHTVHRWKKG